MNIIFWPHNHPHLPVSKWKIIWRLPQPSSSLSFLSMPQLLWEHHDHGSWWRIVSSVTSLYFQINVNLSMMDNTFFWELPNLMGSLNPAAQSRWCCRSAMFLGPNSGEAGLRSCTSVLMGTYTRICNVYIHCIHCIHGQLDKSTHPVLLQTWTAATTTSSSPRWLLRIKAC